MTNALHHHTTIPAPSPGAVDESPDVGCAPPGFGSILFLEPGDATRAETSTAPEFFRDLNLDQIVDAVTAGRDEYTLKPFFFSGPQDPGTIAWRQEVMRDLEGDELLACIKAFSRRMRTVREHLAAAKDSSCREQGERWFLDGAGVYGEAVEALQRDLEQLQPRSRGLSGFLAFLRRHVASATFRELRRQTQHLQRALAEIRYCVLIRGGTVTVRKYAGEIDTSSVVREIFARFQQGATKDRRCRLMDSPHMNHVEAQILERVARLHPEVFEPLTDFCTAHEGFPDRTITGFEREIQFYVAWLDHVATFRRSGLPFCFPGFSAADKQVRSRESFDLALAGKLLREGAAVVRNDFSLEGPERILVVTGPNQGGKTTFARTFGQLHYLASLGCMVPGTEARLLPFDRIFTHFEREEEIATLRGKLQDDLVRMHRILDEATADSIVIINEIFASTTASDAACLGREMMGRLTGLGAIGVCVTFLDELASFNSRTVSVVAGVRPENPTERTFRIERRPADGLAYAQALAGKHGLSRSRLRERLQARPGATGDRPQKP